MSQFKNALLKKIRPIPRSYFNVTDKLGLRRLAQLRVGLSDLPFLNCPIATCACSQGNETTEHFLLECNRFFTERVVLMASLSQALPSIDFNSFASLSNVLLYGSKNFSFFTNTDILNATVTFINSSKRFVKLEFNGI